MDNYTTIQNRRRFRCKRETHEAICRAPVRLVSDVGDVREYDGEGDGEGAGQRDHSEEAPARKNEKERKKVSIFEIITPDCRLDRFNLSAEC